MQQVLKFYIERVSSGVNRLYKWLYDACKSYIFCTDS